MMVVGSLVILLSLMAVTGANSFAWQLQPKSSSYRTRQSFELSHRYQAQHQHSKTLSFSQTKETRTQFPLQRTSPLSMAQQSNNNNNNNNNIQEDYSWLGVLWLPLWLVYISNQWSRSSLYYLVDFSSSANPLVAMNVDLQFTEAQYGVLASVAFTSLYAIATVLAGYISDRYNRKTLTILSVSAWTVATLATAVSTDYTQVLLARVAMGLACAFSTPIGYTLLQQSLPTTQQSFGTGLYGTGVAFGGALGALSLLLDQNYGWRQALFIISAFGATSAVVSTVLLPDDPKVQQPPQEQEVAVPPKTKKALDSKDTKSNDLFFASFTTDIGQVLSTSRVQWLFLASLLRFSSGLCIGVWSAPFFREAFPDHAADYSIIQALITAVAGTVSGLSGGILADKLSATAPTLTTGTTTTTAALDFLNVDSVGRRLYVPVVGSLLAAPAWYWAISQQGVSGGGDGFEWAMIWLTLEYLVAECWRHCSRTLYIDRRHC
jgi:MFS family permease